MLISIVTGTFNRLDYLKAMIASVRETVPASLTLEFVVCDGGSTDGTLDWCKTQPDVRLIEHGALRGALKAFGDAARAAEGDYVILANDDILFVSDSIVRAVAYLESHARCGAVAFQDDRPAPGYPSGVYKTQTMTARRGGKAVSVPYAQVGMFRRWLGEAAGWWGDQHEVMGKGHTYGGDNFLSARIWELGYTVDEVPGAHVDDLIPNDALREHNYKAEQRNPAVYYKVYPDGPLIADMPQFFSPQHEHLRILYLPIYEPGYPQQKAGKRGLREALQRVGLVYEHDYVSSSASLPALVAAWQPHVMLMQLHGVNKVTETQLAESRRRCPGMVVVNWNGDVYDQHLTSPDMLSLLRHVDLQLTVNAQVIPVYEANGLQAAYWQVAYEPVDEARLPTVAAHDVVFLGNAYSDERKQLGATLQAMRVNVGLYGFGWPFASGNTTYNFPAGAALYRSSKIAVGDNQYPGEYGFVSNRLFEALAHGAFLLHQLVPGLEELTGLCDGEHYVAWRDLADLQEKIHHWLTPRYEQRRRHIAGAGQAFVREHHSFDARVKQLFEELLPKVGTP